MSPSRSPEEAPNGSWLAKSIRLAVDFAFRYRRTTVAVIHVGLIVLSNFLAFALRFDAAIPPLQAQAFRQTIIVVVVIRTLVFIPMRLYEGLWRYTGIWDLQRIVAGVLLSSALLFGLLDQLLVVPNYPHSIYLIDTVLLVTMMGGLRLGRRIYREARRSVSSKRVLVLGAGDAGEMIVRDMLKNVAYGMQPVGFIDDDPAKVGKRIHGVPVLGTRDRIGDFIVEGAAGRDPGRDPARVARGASEDRGIAAAVQDPDHDAAEPAGPRRGRGHGQPHQAARDRGPAGAGAGRPRLRARPIAHRRPARARHRRRRLDRLRALPPDRGARTPVAGRARPLREQPARDRRRAR